MRKRGNHLIVAKIDAFRLKRRKVYKKSTNPSTKAAASNIVKREMKEAKRESFGALEPTDIASIWSSSDEDD